MNEKAQSLIEKTGVASLDSDHSRDHVFKEMNLWHPMMDLNSYVCAEDSNVNGYPVHPDFGPSPMEVIDDFFKINDMFRIDLNQEKFLMTQDPRGYLLKAR